MIDVRRRPEVWQIATTSGASDGLGGQCPPPRIWLSLAAMQPVAGSVPGDAATATDRVVVRPGAYHDSIALMLAAREAGGLPGVEAAVASMATPLNLALLRDQGFDVPEEPALTPNDLVLAVRAADADGGDAALAAIERRLAARVAPAAAAGRPAAKSVAALARRRPELSLALVSVPGAHAAYESAAALEAGLHVLCFSDGVGVAAEAALKRRAVERGLLFMGPDCGTAILDGVALGFANRVQRGPVGIVAASGTGAQEVSCLLDSAGVGVSQLVGTGGRDLGAEVGGTMCARALELLAADPGTEAIVVISKPPDPEVAARVAALAGQAGKPVVLAFLGLEGLPDLPGNVEQAASLEDAAARAAAHFGRSLATGAEPARRPTPGFIRGLFSGGTLCDEAMTIVSARVGKVASNIPLRPEWRLDDLRRPSGHAFVDYGDDALTQGRAHPMIDPSLRLEAVERAAADPEVSVIVLDVVLGHAAHADPAGELAPVIRAALDARPELHVIASVCGTPADPQGLDAQRAALAAAGATVTRSSAAAARLALRASGAAA
jgi:FdrA protein